MLWIIALAVPVLGAAIHLIARAEPASAEAIGTIGLLWFAAAFYGVVTFVAGLQHLIAPDRIAKYIGWPTGSGFQRELGWATVGVWRSRHTCAMARATLCAWSLRCGGDLLPWRRGWTRAGDPQDGKPQPWKRRPGFLRRYSRAPVNCRRDLARDTLAIELHEG